MRFNELVPGDMLIGHQCAWFVLSSNNEIVWLWLTSNREHQIIKEPVYAGKITEDFEIVKVKR